MRGTTSMAGRSHWTPLKPMAHQPVVDWRACDQSRRRRSQPYESGSDFWNIIIALLDTLLRSYYAVYEFSDDPNCLLRIGQGVANDRLTLMDGTEIAVGDPIGTLHLWNEHLPRYCPLAGPELSWAAEIRRRLVTSLRTLAHHVDTDPLWRGVRGFRSEVAFSSRLGVSQLDRVARRHGFEWIAPGCSSRWSLHDLGNSIHAYGLARAFNPEAAVRQRFFRRYSELWISRRALLMRYGRSNHSGLPPVYETCSFE
jgi:hypothetical protein